MGSVVSLADCWPNVKEFIDSLFDHDVRSAQNVKDAAANGATTVSFVDDRSRKIILESWLAAWKSVTGVDPHNRDTSYDKYIIQADRDLIQWLTGYIYTTSMRLCRPKLTLSSLSTGVAGVPFYENAGYEVLPFVENDDWSYGSFADNGEPHWNGTVSTFLWLLFHGAHFVIIDNPDDGALPNTKSLAASFDKHIPSAMRSHCPGNSHYPTDLWFKKVGSLTTDEYYLDVDDDYETGEGFILALLIGDTSAGASNSFMQLEGWQAQGEGGLTGGPRHTFDLETHEATFWNISTYGACAYSEKRSTPCFFTQDQQTFSLDLDRTTHMPLYDGAGSLQEHWMKPGYVTGGAVSEVLARVDAAKHFYFFQNKYVIDYDYKNRKMIGDPQLITDVFKGLGDRDVKFETIDAAYAVPLSSSAGDAGHYYFFSGNSYAEYDPKKNRVVKSDVINEPQVPNQNRWRGLTFTTVDAAVYIQRDGGDKIFFFSGSDIERFDLKSGMVDHAWKDILKSYPGFETVDGVEIWDVKKQKVLVFHNDEVGLFDLQKMVPDEHFDIQHLYGKHLFRGLWWT
jgi:hypothetical protein